MMLWIVSTERLWLDRVLTSTAELQTRPSASQERAWGVQVTRGPL